MLACVLLPPTVHAQGVPGLQPTFESDVRVWNRSVAFGWADEPIAESFANRVEVAGSATWRPLGGLTLVGGAELRARTYDAPTDGPRSVDVFLDPTYLQATWGQYRLRAGHQIVRWGRIDEISPLDNVNPVDLRDGPLRPVQERKRPLPMLNLEYVRGLNSVELVWIPHFRPHAFDYFSHNWALFGLGACGAACPEVNAEDVPLTLSNGEVGARLAFALRSWDVSLSGFWTREDTPTAQPLTVPPGVDPGAGQTLADYARLAQFTGQPIDLTYERQWIAGVSTETAMGLYGLRLDASHTRDVALYTARFDVNRRPTTTLAVGVDRRDWHGFYVNLQAVETLVHNFPEATIGRNRWTHTASAEVSRSFWNDDLTVEMSGLYQVAPSSLVVSPSVSLERWGAFRIEAGAHVLDRGTSDVLRYFERNDELYLTAEYRF